MTTCCPPNSHKYLPSSYVPVGSCVAFPQGTECYKVGTPSQNAVLMIPDVFGWNGCRIRNIADQLAEAGYYVLIPKLLVPNFEGGTDGDGLPANFFEVNGEKFGTYIATITWEDIIKPKVIECLTHFKESGITKIGILGFCWGGVMVANTIIEFSEEYNIVCGINPHPSFQLIDAFYGKSALKLLSNVKKPFLLMPAGGDPDNIKPGGELFEALKQSSPESETSTDFADMQHGWSLRGDTADEKIKIKVELFLDKTYAFLTKYCK